MSEIDLHDLAAILLHEWSLFEERFLHSKLVEVTDGSPPTKALPDHVDLPILTSLLLSGRPCRAYFLQDENIPDTLPTDAFDFKHKDYTSITQFSEKDIESMFWEIKNHDRGFVLANAMQLVLDSLPKSTNVRIRTSQGYSLVCPAQEFAIANLDVLPHRTCYIASITKLPPPAEPTQIALSQFLTGEKGDFPWVYLIFGGPSVARSEVKLDGRVALDLASPLFAGMRGLGGEPFSLEKMYDYHTKCIPRGGEEMPTDMYLSGRLGSVGRPKRPEQVEMAKELAERVEGRVSRKLEAGEKSCGYCGKSRPKFKCNGCKIASYCDGRCQKMGWTYHKKWCKRDAAAKT
jgi:hypothetical protein